MLSPTKVSRRTSSTWIRAEAPSEEGLKAESFYVAPRGGPTRAMLLTGVDNHVAGFGATTRRIAPGQEGRPGYEGVLNGNVVTVGLDGLIVEWDAVTSKW